MISPQTLEVINYLKEHLQVSIRTDEMCGKVTVSVNVSIEDEIITTCEDSFYLPDTTAYY